MVVQLCCLSPGSTSKSLKVGGMGVGVIPNQPIDKTIVVLHNILLNLIHINLVRHIYVIEPGQHWCYDLVGAKPRFIVNHTLGDKFQ